MRYLSHFLEGRKVKHLSLVMLVCLLCVCSFFSGCATNNGIKSPTSSFEGAETQETSNRLTHDPLDLSTITSSSDAIDRRVKAIGLTDYDRAEFGLKLQRHLNEMALKIAPLELEARKTVALQTAQEAVNNSRVQMNANFLLYDDLQKNTFSAYAGPAMSAFGTDEKKYLLGEEFGQNAKMYVQKGIDDKNPQVINGFLQGAYNKEIMVMHDSINELHILREAASKAQTAIKITDAFNQYRPDFVAAATNPDIARQKEAEIRARKDLSPPEQEMVINKLQAESKTEHERITIEKATGQAREKDAIDALMKNSDYQGALDAVGNAKYLSPEQGK